MSRWRTRTWGWTRDALAGPTSRAYGGGHFAAFAPICPCRDHTYDGWRMVRVVSL